MLFKNEGLFGRTFGVCLKLEDFKTPEKVGGEEVLIPLKNEAKKGLLKIKGPRLNKEVNGI